MYLAHIYSNTAYTPSFPQKLFGFGQSDHKKTCTEINEICELQLYWTKCIVFCATFFSLSAIHYQAPVKYVINPLYKTHLLINVTEIRMSGLRNS
jgi:hypothetical protein